VSGRFEAGEARVQAKAHLLPLVQSLVLLFVVLLFVNRNNLPDDVIRNLVSLLFGKEAHSPYRAWDLLVNVFRLVTYVAGVAATLRMAVALALTIRVRRSVPDRPVPVSADEAGLHADGRLLVSKADVVSAEVTVDPDIGFAVVVQSRSATVRIPLRDEADARALAIALDPTAGLQCALVFEGVADGRWRETLAATGAAVAALALFVARDSPNELGFSDWMQRAWEGGSLQHPGSPEFWLAFSFEALGYWAFMAAAVRAVRPVMARLRTGRVTVDRAGLSLGEGKTARRIEREDIETVASGDAAEVRLGLRGGRFVRLRFAPDRAVVERDAFVARVRAMMGDTPLETYPAAETSGVRVALRADDAVTPDVAAASDEDAEAEPQAPRARRR
jgi:hypothetical protein